MVPWVLGALPGKQLLFCRDVNRFARRDVAQEIEAKRIHQRHAFGCHDIFITPVCQRAFTNNQRTDAVGVAKRKQAVADYHADAGVGNANLLMARRYRREDAVRLQRVIRETIQLRGEDVKQDFRIGGGIDMAPSVFKQLFTQFVSVGQVTVVYQGDVARGELT